MPILNYKLVEFGTKIASHDDLSIFKPQLPDGWYYLGPVATSDDVREQRGMIVKAAAKDALADVKDWKKVGPDNGSEPSPPFSTWRGVAPDGYVVVGDFFVKGNDKPSDEQTAGIKAIRKDLVSELPVQRQVWKGGQSSSVVTLWDVVAVPLLFVPTGAFASSPTENPGETRLAVVRFNVNQ